MEEDFQQPVKKCVKTLKFSRKSSLKSSKPRRKVLVGLRKPLTTKKAVELLLKGTLKRKVCRYCLNISYPLSDLDQCLTIGGQGALYNVAIRDIVAAVHPFKVVEEPNLPNKICAKCTNQALQAYLFAQQCEQAMRAVRNCFDDMHDKLQKLDPLDPTKKRGRQKFHPNHNILYTEHAKVIDYAEPIINLINSGSVSVTNEPEMSELECKKCWQVLPNVESLVNHEKVHPKTMWYHCRLCGQSFAKLLHIRRHLRDEHCQARATPENQSFMCKQCSFASEDYSTHLQHVEKHKFKIVMEHLVEQKMDELCSVCLDKGALQDLGKTIRLHGAYPELTGNRSLYNIIGSTIPEKEKYKYKDLLVPSYANVLSITKKAKNKIFVDHDQAEKLINFTISNPFIVSKERVGELGDKDMYIFIFSEPEIAFPDTLLKTEEKKVDTVDESLKKNGNHDVHDVERPKIYDPNVEKENDNFINNNTEFIQKATVNSSVENETVMTLKKRDINDMDDVSTTCKFCWVFKKTSHCDVCKKEFLVKSKDPKPAKCFENEAEYNTSDTDVAMVAAVRNSMSAYTDDKAKECNFCWVFKTTSKCGYCQTPFKNTFTKTKPVLDTVNIPENVVEKSKAQKRKSDASVKKTNSKKARWECSICLTVNDSDREACLCCDTKVLKDDVLKINLGSNATFLEGIHETSKETHLSCSDVASDIETKRVNNDLADSSNDNMDFNGDNKASTSENYTPSVLHEVLTITNIESTEMQYSNYMESTNEKIDVNPLLEDAMDFEVIDDMNKPTRPLCADPLQAFFLTEDFIPNPVENNTFNFSTPRTTIQTSVNSQPKTFQFNIGSSFQDTKPARKKRPLRRIATTVNK